MRIDGNSYSKIAATLGLSVNSVKSYGRRINLQIKTKTNEPFMKDLDDKKYDNCKNCGNALIHKDKCKPKKFCCDKCRQEWWKNNTDKLNKLSVYFLVCNHCGITFESYGNRHRKYCNHSCYINARFRSKEYDSTA